MEPLEHSTSSENDTLEVLDVLLDDDDEDDRDEEEAVEAVEALSGLTGTTTGDSVLQFSQLQQKYFLFSLNVK